jgi:hypothetical protein
MLASDIITRVSTTVFDNTGVRWAQPELLNHVTDAQRQIVLLRPDANSVTASVQLITGTKQSIPSGSTPLDPNGVSTPAGIRFLRATRNMGADGKTPGRAIRECSRVALDNEIPDWHSASPTTNLVQHTIFDNIAPRTFYVYPGIANGATPYIELVYAALPAVVTLPNQVLSLSDEYINAVVDWALFRCYAKDAAYAGNMQRAQAHYEMFGNSLQVTMNSDFMAAAAQQATPTPAAAAQSRTGG